jgi:MoaA/NifB/PqqE/SkfB family radical SAM enzyme
MKFGVEQAAGYLTKNPEKNVPRVMDWVDRLSGENFEKQRDAVRKVIGDPENCYHQMMFRALSDLDPEVVKTFFVNFFVNANIISWQREEEYRKKYHCNIPWTILLDPTSACNLHCTGCWAAEYGNRLNLSVDEIDDIIRQGKEMGVYFYIYTGGEPLTRKGDLIKICEKHSDCEFLCFTNGTLIDEAFADEMLRVRNFIPAISVEGFEEATDDRRGAGTYRKVIKAMALLRSKHLPFGASCCYTSRNIDSLTSEAYYDMLIENGALFVWFFHYMPVGVDAVPELLCTPEQRAQIYRAVRDYRSRKQIFAIDFQNDAEYVGGCIAGGRRYLHINANGDADPCVFIHYSDSNIREKTLLEALTSPLFMAYHDGQPFNENMLRPCPMLENPEKLPEMEERSGAHSTDLQAPESAEHLCDKCRQYAADWAPSAAGLWHGSAGGKRCREAEQAERETVAV